MTRTGGASDAASKDTLDRGPRSLPGALRGSRAPVAFVALWLLAAGLAVTQATRVLTKPPDQRLLDLDSWFGVSGVLHLPGSLYAGDAHGGRFTGTPFAGLVLQPLTKAAEHTLGIVWTITTLLIMVAIGFLVAAALPAVERRGRRAVLLVAPAVISVLVLSLPVRGTLMLGTMSLLPVLLVLPAFLLPDALAAWQGRTAQPLSPRAGRAVGIAAGLGAALQPALVLLALVLWFAGRRRSAVTTAVVFVACTGLAWAALPHDSSTYWVHHLAGAGLGGAPDALSNQSLHGLLLRLHLHGPAEYAVFGVLAATVVVFGVRRSAAYLRDGQAALGAAVAGCIVVAVSPVAWQHQQFWILLAAVGRLGKGAADRLVWPIVVVVVMTVSSHTLAPGHWQALRVTADNAPLLLALLTTLALPFVRRSSPHWNAIVPPYDARERSTRLRWLPLLPPRMRALSRPALLLELVMVRAGYQLYSITRAAVPDQRQIAEHHGTQVLSIEKFLHVDVEHALNHFVAKVGWLKDSMNFYYESFHFVIPLSLLAFLYLRRPTAYRSARTALAVATALGLVGFWLYPLAPPRLMPHRGFIDTAHGVQNLNDPNYGTFTKISNQYAAMPSLHVGWSLWCGLVILALAPWVWLKVLGMMYPVLTAIVVMGTANHYVLDAVGGILCVTCGFLAQFALTGRSPFADLAGRSELPLATASGPLKIPRPYKRSIADKILIGR